MIFDTDDFHESNHRLDLLYELKQANPAFRMTAFAVPAYCSPEFLESLPDWIEVAVHGWHHGGKECRDAREAEFWTYTTARRVIEATEDRFVHGFKAPGWQISNPTYHALLQAGWWVADQRYNDHRRPHGIAYHCEGELDHVHTHVQNVCGNGLDETFPMLLERVKRAQEFLYVSEATRVWGEDL